MDSLVRMRRGRIRREYFITISNSGCSSLSLAYNGVVDVGPWLTRMGLMPSSDSNLRPLCWRETIDDPNTTEN